MEEYVEERVNSLYEQLKGKNKPGWLTCDCDRCKMDSTAYVLNKVKPYYIVSGRGVVYSEQELINHQLKADVDALVLEAIRTVASTQRPNHEIMSYIDKSYDKSVEVPSFNFPIISGSVLNGSTFEPLTDAEIILYDEKGVALMQDSSFLNPTKTFNSTKGSYTFWPQAIKAEKEGITKAFHFIVEAKAEGFSSLQTCFDINVTSEEKKAIDFTSNLSIKVKDLILFKK